MRATNGQKIYALVFAVAKQDSINQGVAKARLAGEASYSVALLEKLMRGVHTSEFNQVRTVDAAKARGLKFEMDDLFPSIKGKEHAF